MVKKITKSKSTKTSKPKVKKVIGASKKTKFTSTEFDVCAHVLVPKHTLLSNKQKEELFKIYNITTKELPKIMLKDPAIQHLEPKVDDVIKIERNSITAEKSIFYRGVINE